MNSVKIIHCADVHIGAAESYLGVNASSKRYETLITFESIINTAVDGEVKVVLIAGDLFDSNNVESAFVTAVLEKIASAKDIKFVFAAGNHDPLNAESPFKNNILPDNLYVMNTEDDCIVFDDIKTRVFGKSFEGVYMKGSHAFSLKPTQDDYINLMVIHGDLTSSLSSDYNSITPNFVKASDMNYIALGHIHKHSDILKLGSTYFAYCGCPESHGFDETDKKGIYIGEVTKNGCNLEFVSVSKRNHIYEKIDVTGMTVSSEICDKIINTLKEKYADGFENNLYKIELLGEIPTDSVLNINEISARILNFVYFAKIKDKTEPIIDTELLSAEVSLKGLFVKNFLKKIDIASEDEKLVLREALKLGLTAFNTEVTYDED